MSRKIIGITVGTTINPDKFGGKTLPTVTDKEEGKVLKVQGGQWSVEENDAEKFGGQSPDYYAKTTELPSKLSELENDTGYLTEHQDLSAFATKDELPSKVSELENDKGYLTEHQSLDNYYTKSETAEALNKKQDVLPKYVESVNGYSGEVKLSASDVKALPDSTVIPTVPNVVSAFTNDADYASRTYVSEVSAGKCKAYTFGTTAELDEWLSVDENTVGLNNGDVFYIREVGVPDYWWDKETQSKQILETTKVDLADYARKDSIPKNVSQLVNDAKYITTSEADTKLGEKQDKLTEYVTSVNGKSGKVSLNSSDVGALPSDTFIPGKVSQLENDKGYLTEHQDLSAYAKKNELPTVPTKVSSFENDVGYAKKTDIPTIPSSLPANGGNADTVDGKHIIVTSSAPTNNDTSVITVVI